MNPAATTSSNRRRQPRRQSKRATKVQCTRGILQMGRNLARTILDLSATGAALVVSESFGTGEALVLSFDINWRPRPLCVPGRVIWCVPTSDNSYCIGIKLDTALEHRDLNEFATS